MQEEKDQDEKFEFGTLLLYLGLALGLLFALFPVVWMVFTSLKSNTEIFALPPRLLPDVFTLDAYRSIFADPAKVRFFINSYLVSGAVAFLTLIVSTLAAYGFSRYSFPFKNVFNVIIISTQTVPPITLLIPYFGMVVAFPAWVVAVLAAAATLPGAAWRAVGRGLPADLAPAPRPTPPPEPALTP